MELKTQRAVLTAVVALFTMVCVFAMDATAQNYVEVARATQQMGGELISLETVGEDTILLTFEFNNASALELVLLRIQVNVYVNDVFIGNFDMKDKTYLKNGVAHVVLTGKVHPYNLPKYEAEIDKGEVQWFIVGAAVVQLPFHNETVNLRIEEAWGG